MARWRMSLELKENASARRNAVFLPPSLGPKELKVLFYLNSTSSSNFYPTPSLIVFPAFLHIIFTPGKNIYQNTEADTTFSIFMFEIFHNKKHFFFKKALQLQIICGFDCQDTDPEHTMCYNVLGKLWIFLPNIK